MKPTLVIRLESGIPSVYLDSPLDLDIVIDDSDDYRQGLACIPAFFLEPEVNPEEVSASIALALTQEIPGAELP
jgi:hypothetical protein